MKRELAQFAEAYDDVKGHPCTGKPASPIMRAQQKNSANDCEKLSDLDPNPIRRVTVTEVSNEAADTHGQIKAGDQDYRDRNPLTAHSLADFLGSVLIHMNLKAATIRASGQFCLSQSRQSPTSHGVPPQLGGGLVEFARGKGRGRGRCRWQI